MFAKFKAFLPKVIFSLLPFDNCLVSSLPHSERVQLHQRYVCMIFIPVQCTRSIQDIIHSACRSNWDLNLLLDLTSKVLNTRSTKCRVGKKRTFNVIFRCTLAYICFQWRRKCSFCASQEKKLVSCKRH